MVCIPLFPFRALVYHLIRYFIISYSTVDQNSFFSRGSGIAARNLKVLAETRSGNRKGHDFLRRGHQSPDRERSRPY